jgi:hypothetical protein
MSRYIDADKLRKDEIARCHCVPCVGSNDNNYKDLDEVLNDAPTADVVEVVRCKDCKHHPDNDGECDRSITHTGRDYVCEVNTYRYIGIDYCSYGERKEE